MRRLFGPARWLALVPLLLLAAPSSQAQLSWDITYLDNGTNAGFYDPTVGTTRRDTVASALDYIASQIDARGTIQFEMLLSLNDNTPGSVLAEASSQFTSPAGFQNGAVFQRGTTGTVPSDPGIPPDGSGQFNFGYTWNNGLAAPGGGEYDLFSVALHEFTHAIGFVSQIQSSGAGFLNSTLGEPDVYTYLDKNLQVGSAPGGTSLITTGNAFNTPAVSASDLANNNVYFNGEYAKAANGGSTVKIYAPNPYEDGSSLSHVDPSASSATNAVMQPTINPGDERRQYLAFEIGMLIDMGWNQYVWTAAGSERWGDNTGSSGGSPWKNIQGQASYSPVGTITPNLVLTFRGNDPAGYTSTNNLELLGTPATNGDANRFLVNRIVLDSTSAVTNVIAAESNQVLRFTTTIGIAPEIRQTNTAGFTISHPIELTNSGLTVGGDGTGVVTLSGTISEQTGQVGTINKSGSSEFILAGDNTYTGTTTVKSGTLRVANASGSATGTGEVIVENGGTLAGVQNLPVGFAGFLSGDVTVKDGGIIRPGSSSASFAGQINFNGSVQTVTLETGSRYAWSLTSLTTESGDAGIGYDQLLLMNGDGLSLSGANVLLVFSASTTPNGNSFWDSNRSWTIFDVQSGSNSTQFAGIVNPNFSGVGMFSLATGVNGSIVLEFTPVPEPASVFGAATLVLGVFAYRRRHRAG